MKASAHGGFGFPSRMWGLTLDHTVSVDLVLANGSLITASDHQHPDIFWVCPNLILWRTHSKHAYLGYPRCRKFIRNCHFCRIQDAPGPSVWRCLHVHMDIECIRRHECFGKLSDIHPIRYPSRTRSHVIFPSWGTQRLRPIWFDWGMVR